MPSADGYADAFPAHSRPLPYVPGGFAGYSTALRSYRSCDGWQERCR